MSEHLYLISIGMIPVTILLIFGMKYLSAASQVRSRLASDNAYRELAEKAVTVQSGNAASLSAIQAELADIGGRLAAVEKILKAVE
jgi:hypothetical protein